MNASELREHHGAWRSALYMAAHAAETVDEELDWNREIAALDYLVSHFPGAKDEPARPAPPQEVEGKDWPDGFGPDVDERNVCRRCTVYGKHSVAMCAMYLNQQKIKLMDFAKRVRDDYDCDGDAHKYGTPCRACAAASVVNDLSCTVTPARTRDEGQAEGRPPRPPMLLAQFGVVMGLSDHSWYIRFGDAWAADFHCMRSPQLTIDRTASDPEAVRLYDADLTPEPSP